MTALRAYGYITSITGAITILAHGYMERSERVPTLPLSLHLVGGARDAFLGFLLGPILVPRYLLLPIKNRNRCPLS
jgi:hypothetical protein